MANQTEHKGNNAESNWFGAFEDLRAYDAAIEKLFTSVNNAIDETINEDKTGAYKTKTSAEKRREFYCKKLQWGLMNFMKLFEGSSDTSKKFAAYVKSWKGGLGIAHTLLASPYNKLFHGTMFAAPIDNTVD